MSWHSCKVISLFPENVEGSRWGLQTPFSLLGLELTVLCDGWRQRPPPPQKRNLQAALPSGLFRFVATPLFPFFQVRLEEYLKRLQLSFHRKWNVELPTAQWQRNPWSLFLSTWTPTHAQTACTNTVWGISLGTGRALQELPPPHSSSSDHQHLTVEILLLSRLSGSQASLWVAKHPSLDSPKSSLFFVCQLLHLFT